MFAEIEITLLGEINIKEWAIGTSNGPAIEENEVDGIIDRKSKNITTEQLIENYSPNMPKSKKMKLHN